MAKRPSTLTGLEIEPSAVYAATVTTGARLTVRHAALMPLEPGIVRDGEVIDVDALSEVLRTMFRDHKDLDKRVRIGIANQKIVVRVIELPPITDPKQLDSAVRFQAQEEIPMPMDSAIVDYVPLDIVQTDSGPRQRVALVAARRDMVERVVAAVRGAGLRPEGVDLAAFGMVRALHRHGLGGDRVVYISVGGLTNVAVAEGTVCHFTRVVGGGLESLAVELAERRSLTLEQARTWLAHTGLELPVESIEGYTEHPEIVEDARAVLSDGVRRIAGEVKGSVDFHYAQGDGIGVERCVLTGQAAALSGFATALGAELGLPIEVGRVDAPAGLDAERLTVAAGLALYEAAA